MSITTPAGETDAGFRSDSAATLTVKNQTSDQNLHGNLWGAVSLDYASANGRRLLLCGTANDTTGKITVRSGTVAVNTNAVFSALSGIDVCESGTFEVCVAEDTMGQIACQPSFKTEGLTVTCSGDGKLKIPAGVVLEVDKAIVNDTALGTGLYTKDSSEIGAFIEGEGTLSVLNIEKKTEGSTFTWKGGANNNALEEPTNWKEGTPKFDGTERLVFGADGTAQAVVSGLVNVFAIEITGNQDFTLSAGNDTAKITLQQGGFTLTNQVDDTLVTHTVSCPVELGYVPQTWIVGGDTQFDNQASISSAERENPGTLTIKSSGRVMFKADNSQLFACLVLTNCATSASQPYVYHEKGLGAPTRETMVFGSVPRFMTDMLAMTNDVPLRLWQKETNKDFVYLNGSEKNPLYMNGAVTFFGAGAAADLVNGAFNSEGNVHFRGGISHADDLNFMLVARRDVYIEGERGLSTAGLIEMLGIGSYYRLNLHLAATNNNWRELAVFDSHVKLYVTNALAVGKSVKLGDSRSWALKNTAALDLNGFDQSISRLYTGFTAEQIGDDKYATVKSDMPAMLEIKQESAVNDLAAIKFTGDVGLRFDAPGSIAFTNYTSTTTGTLDVERGTVKFCAGSGWVNVTNVILGANGVIEVGAGAGATAFGPEQGKSAAEVTRKPGGVFRIAAGETATVHTITVADGRNHYLAPGVYGAAGTPGVTRPVAWVTGGGLLTVTSSLAKGTILIIR